MKVLATTILIATFGFTAPALATTYLRTRTIEHPDYAGYHLDWCLTWATDCGRPAARAYCKSRGFKDVVNFRKTDRARSATKTINGNEVCRTGVNHPHCDGFTWIECEYY
jgi:hypothetical protein